MLDRALISRRLKAARWLAGTARNERGQVIPMKASELAGMEPLQRNRVSANRIEDIEQERVGARPLELEAITVALGLPDDWFTGASAAPSGGDDFEQAVRTHITWSQVAARNVADARTQAYAELLAILNANNELLTRLATEFRELRADLFEQELEDRAQRSRERADSSERGARGQHDRD